MFDGRCVHKSVEVNSSMTGVALFFENVCNIHYRAGFWERRVQVSLFIQSQRRGLKIREDRRPTLCAKSFDRGALGGLPGWREFFDLSSAFDGDRQFHTIAAATTVNLDQTITLQRPEVPDKGCALHSKPIAEVGHVPGVFGLQRRQNRALSGTDSVPPHFKVIKLRNYPGHPTQVK